MTNERECLLRKINVISFAMDDTRLYLDTHPCDGDAMCHFEMLHNMRCAAIDEYVCKYGPLGGYNYTEAESWSWAEAPQPWEKGANV